MFTSKPPPSRLLTLPAEIRTLIFEFALTSSSKPTVTFRLDPYQLDTYTPAVQPPLTRVSRQLREETLPIYYELTPFILHSEAPKADDALRWLRCNEAYLPLLRRLTFWIRYVPARGSAGVGAFGVGIGRARKGGEWAVEEEWRWITVVRRPGDVEGDAKVLLGRMGVVLKEGGLGEGAGPEEFVGFMERVRGEYVRGKMG
ncbi:hypothetical protein M409DRAFT_63501 [Zasmidium cellare ATCC 36951]|uniref:F-box domain-containing protein n=1 Tax=Zasmidium cellare ATCC 36951 TaxID=1080233 RepID=A0A6A6D1D8_ZASCE|nr:uncharacterized protein M409DRAFT_63501 [Zasmidium cellare ATCC 36951]KAF2171982.1 hypothetical protein M409DRAFT_63501 [Zasmidium cellare ATCC 36951]